MATPPPKHEKAPPNVFLQSAQFLAEARKRHSGVIVSYSGGKDSLVVLDQCVKAGFTQIVCMYYYLIPGIKVVEKQLQYARERYKVEVLEYPSPLILTLLKSGMYSDPSLRLDRIPQWHVDDIEEMCRADTGIKLIATGHKKSDAMGQGLSNAVWANKKENQVQPIINWNKFHLLSYMKAHNIPMPESDGRNSSSMDLHPKNILWLHDNHYEDFVTFEKVFPYIRAIVKRREWYQIPS
jgi:hypothetical protein